MGRTRIQLKRVYDLPVAGDGFRILVDRLWPRGVSKERAKVDLWMKEVAPTHALRRWFGHDRERWGQFREKYRQELVDNKAFKDLQSIVRQKPRVTLLFAAADCECNNAVVIKEFLR